MTDRREIKKQLKEVKEEIKEKKEELELLNTRKAELKKKYEEFGGGETDSDADTQG